jgi:hypothetical protein
MRKSEQFATARPNIVQLRLLETRETSPPTKEAKSALLCASLQFSRFWAVASAFHIMSELLTF